MILCDLADWHLTITTASSRLVQIENPSVVAFGTIDGIPASVARDMGLEIIKWKDISLMASSDRPLSGFATPTASATHDRRYPPHAVAVIGMACKFPGADSIEEFWKVLASGSSMCEEIPSTRFSTRGLRRSSNDKLKFWGNFVRDADAFDHRFFKKSSREAASMDPQQRILLEVAYSAMESSGYFGDFRSEKAHDIGVYLGACSSDYNDNVASHNPTAFASLGTLRAFLSGRISHWFDWTGPSVTYDTACSSSAVAIHSACKAIQTGECTQALAGGVSLYTSPNFYQNLAAASFLSPSGPTKPFDADADGYCRGEGAGLVVLKGLSDAVADGDNIIGVITGSAVNQNRNSTYITVPHGGSQQELYQKVSSLASIKASDVSFVEAHGTGTPVGDPIELDSIRKVFGGANRRHPLNVSSVKGNIGHLEGAAGVAALIKVCLMMQKKTLPMQANFRVLNPKIPALDSDRTVIATTTGPWESDIRYACVNNYGAAGSNAAMIVCEGPSNVPLSPSSQAPRLPPNLGKYPIYLSANSIESLSMYCKSLLTYVGEESKIFQGRLEASLAYNLANKQNRTLPYIIAETVSSWDAVTEILASAASEAQGNIIKIEKGKPKPVVLCFGGQVANHVGLSEEVFRSSAVLQSHLDRCNAALTSSNLPSLYPTIFQTRPVENVVQLHGMLFSLQYACAMSWIDCGLKVDALIGHSFGQLTALCVSGSLSLEDGLKLVCGRAKLMQTHWGPQPGSMISVEADISTVLDLISSINEGTSSDKLEIACYNGPTSHVLVGSSAAVDRVEKLLQDRQAAPDVTNYRKLNVTHGFHSALTEPLLLKLVDLAEGLDFAEAKIPLETCSNGGSWSRPTPQLIAEHTRTPVYFGQAVKRLISRLGSCTWLEAGSASSVTNIVRRAIPEQSRPSHTFVPLGLGGLNGRATLADATVSLWQAGHVVQFWPFDRSQKDSFQPMNLPPYEFERSRHWIDWVDHADASEAEPKPFSQEVDLKLLSFIKFIDQDHQTAEFAVNPLSKEYELYVGGHAVLNRPLVPAPLYCELAAQAATVLLSDSSSLPSRNPTIEDLVIQAPLGRDIHRTIILLLEKSVTGDATYDFSFKSHSTSSQLSGKVLVHATGKISLTPEGSKSLADFARYEKLIGIDRARKVIEDNDSEAMQGSMIYKMFARVVTYAPFYKGVRSVYGRAQEVAGIIRLPKHDAVLSDNTILTPLALDNFIQVAGLHVNTLNECAENEVYVCTAVDAIKCGQKLQASDKKSWMVYSNYETLGPKKIMNDIFVFDMDSKRLVLMILGAQFTRVAIKSLVKLLSSANQAKAGDEREAHDVETARLTPVHILPEGKPVLLATADPSSKSKPKPKLNPAASASADVDRDVRIVLNKVSEVPIAEIKDDSTLDDLGIDSLMIMEVLTEVQSFFKLEIPPVEWQTLGTPKLLARYLENRGCGAKSDDSGSNDDDSSSGSAEDTGLSTPEPEIDPQSFRKPEHSPPPLLPKPATLRSPSIPRISSRQLSTRSGQSSTSGPPLIGAQQAFDDIRHDYDIYTQETGFANFWKQVYPQQARLVLAYTVEAFEKLGCHLTSLAEDERIPLIQYLPKHHLFVRQLHAILQDGALIYLNNGEYYRTGKRVDPTPSSVLYDSVTRMFPQHASELQLLRITASQLAECLSGTSDPLQLLFVDKGNKDILEEVYTNGPMYRAITKLLGSYLVKAFSGSSQDKPFSILELGGGTGGTTKHVIECLKQANISFTYTFTDLSGSLVTAARRKFSNVSNMTFGVINIEKAPAEKHLGKYHCILSTNCIHATSNLTKSASNIRQMLRPDGFVSMVEFTKNIYWFDLVFGLLEGWWLFEDGRKHVLADQLFWDSSMRTAGFKHVTWTDGASEESRTLRIITGFVAEAESNGLKLRRSSWKRRTDAAVQTVEWKREGNCSLFADIYLPPSHDVSGKKRPIGAFPPYSNEHA